MGRVWRATDVVLHREVAIKELVPPPGLTPDERREMRERSLREARAIARLNNINVVRVFDVLRTDADPWIVMEYVPSRSLQDILAADGPFAPVRAAEIGLGVLNALRAAHRAGVVHRDVKPGNVLISEDGRVVLTDFGLATVPGDPNVTRTGLVLGSPAYIAPERARDGTAGPGADLWSLGATLYAAVEGASPFARPSAIATLAALATENPPPARNAGPLKPVLNGLLRKDPAHRINAEEAERLLLRATGRRSKLSFPMSPTMRRPGVGRERPSAALSPPVVPGVSASAPVVPGPRPPVSPARPPVSPGRPPASAARPPVEPPAGGPPPRFTPGKAVVGRPPAETPTRVDGPKPPALDATKIENRSGTDTAPPTTPPASARPSRGAAPDATMRGSGSAPGSFTADEVAAARKRPTGRTAVPITPAVRPAPAASSGPAVADAPTEVKNPPAKRDSTAPATPAPAAGPATPAPATHAPAATAPATSAPAPAEPATPAPAPATPAPVPATPAPAPATTAPAPATTAPAASAPAAAASSPAAPAPVEAEQPEPPAKSTVTTPTDESAAPPVEAGTATDTQQPSTETPEAVDEASEARTPEAATSEAVTEAPEAAASEAAASEAATPESVTQAPEAVEETPEPTKPALAAASLATSKAARKKARAAGTTTKPDQPAEAVPAEAALAEAEPVTSKDAEPVENKDAEPATNKEATTPAEEEPTTAEPKAAEPVTAEPQAAEPVTAESQAAAPTTTEPKAEEPNPDTAESKAEEPKTAEAPTEPPTADSDPAPKTNSITPAAPETDGKPQAKPGTTPDRTRIIKPVTPADATKPRTTGGTPKRPQKTAAERKASTRVGAVPAARTEAASARAAAPTSGVPGFGQPSRPAWQPMNLREPSSGPRGITIFGTTLTRRQTVIAIAVLAAVLLALIVVIPQAFGGEEDKPDGRKAGVAPAASATKPTTAATTAAPAPAAPAPESPSPSPSSAAPSSPPPPAQGDVKIPKGWYRYSDDTGFSVPLPNGTSIERQGTEVYFTKNNRLLIIDQTDKPRPDPVADWEQQEDDRAGRNYRNYNRIKIQPVDYFVKAADWEFTYTTSSGNPQHAVKRGVITKAGKQAYGLSWYTSPGDWDAGKKDLQLIYQGFKPKS
ncbi:Serine/threonine protein kinase [Actinoplanes friuliensis DSM 7358]|uniref:Serine/threonine protein kinase n=1 Tax=Actinoplanes friuliensis DSM 7358 TaxID=1246995 RepID=U5WAB0_9ACTN|nr:Serine/threonine protein kinase [Actinoplanes friuliensis DSM 7358]